MPCVNQPNLTYTNSQLLFLFFVTSLIFAISPSSDPTNFKSVQNSSLLHRFNKSIMKEKDSTPTTSSVTSVPPDVSGHSASTQSTTSNPSLPSTDLETDGSDSTSSYISLIREEKEENDFLRNENVKLKEHVRILGNRLSNLGQTAQCTVGANELLMPETSKELVDNLVRENIRLKREQQKGQASHQSAEMDNTKDVVIGSLQAKLEESQQQLTELAEQCRQLVIQQDDNKSSSSISDNIGRLSLDNNEVTQLRKQNTNFQIEIGQLKKQLQEVVQVNSRWKDYDRQREEHVQGIKGSMAEAEFTVQRLADQNKGLENQVRQLKQAISHLQKNTGGMSQEQSDRMHALERQVQEFTEAYQQSQKDREKSQAKLADLEETNYILKKQLEQFQTTQMNYLAERRTEAMRRHRMEYEQRIASPYMNQRQIISHGGGNSFAVVADGDDGDEEIEDEDVVDLPMSYSTSNPSSGPSTENSLDCPKCKQKFPVSEPMRFLEHNDQCQG